MAEPFLSEIRIVSFRFAPRGWAMCNGQLLPISQNQALYSLIGTTYGGDGQSTFALPDLRGRAPIHMGDGPGLRRRDIGETGGSERVTLLVDHLPPHRHAIRASSGQANRSAPRRNVLAAGGSYTTRPDKQTVMDARMVDLEGGGEAHDNMPPFLALNCIIALSGIYPSA
jgi:microcystin-dependent protein